MDEQEINNAFKKLPENIQKAITNSAWQQALREIIKKHNLHLDQGIEIEASTIKVMLGIEDPEDYVLDLVVQAEIEEEVASEIAKEVEQSIFAPIKESLIKISREKKDESELTKEQVLREIEEPHPAQVLTPETTTQTSTPPNLPTGIMEQKLSAMVQLPHEEIFKSEEKDTKSETPPQPSAPKSYTTDPYREPIG